jgi:hypothetical protein
MNNTLYKIPLTLGITGHRDLREEDKEKLCDAIRQLFQFLRLHYPQTPLKLLSPLADGADRLVAQMALEEKVQLAVPLPMPRDLYRNDFETPDSKAEFDDFWEKAQDKFELSLLEGNTPEKIKSYGINRTKQYAFAGAYIARHSHILIALWDGLHLEKSAGTSQVVQFKLTGNMKDLPDEYKPQQGCLDNPDTGPVCYVKTGRKNDQPVDCVGEIQVLLPNVKEAQNDLKYLLSDDLAALNCFNQDVEKYANNTKLQQRIQKGQTYLLPDRLWERLSPAFPPMLGAYSTANTLARHFHSRLKLFTMLLLWIVAGMVSLYGWYSSVGEYNLSALVGYLILFLGAWGVLFFVKRQRYESHQLDYRALAEGLRVQVFWHLGGLTHSVADHYLRKQRDELSWIRGAIRALNIYDWVKNTESLEVVYRHWFNNQRDWLNSSAQQNQDKAKKYDQWIKYLFMSGFVLIFAMLVMQVMGGLQSHLLLHNVLILLIALVPTVGVLLLHYTEKMAFDEHAKQYGRMAKLFAKGSHALDDIIKRQQTVKNDPDKSKAYQKEAEQLLFDLGKEALQENADWVLLHRKKPFELPQSEV